MSERNLSEHATQFSIGQHIEPDAKRDAIHIAVAPVIASERLAPGQHIGFVSGHEVVGAAAVHIGIVDPFLAGPVFKDDRFWMFLYPNTIQSLRHQWTHPAFEGSTEPEHISQEDHVAKSKAWIAAHAAHLGLSTDVLMQDAEWWIKYDEHKIQHGSERWRDNFDATEFWHHYEIVTGTVVDADKKQSFYCCTC